MKYTQNTLVVEKGHTLKLSQHNGSIMPKYIEDWLYIGRASIRTAIYLRGEVFASSIYQNEQDTPRYIWHKDQPNQYTTGIYIPETTIAGDMRNARVYVTIDRKRYGNPVTPEGKVLKEDIAKPYLGEVQEK